MKQQLPRRVLLALLGCGSAMWLAGASAAAPATAIVSTASTAAVAPAITTATPGTGTAVVNPATNTRATPGAANAGKYKTNVPPSAELSYAIRARQRGILLDGSAVVRWTASGRTFSATNETRTKLIGKILDARTDGLIDDYGLAPLRFDEKRFSKKATATSFDRATRTIRFSASDATYPITGGEQDRNSIIWQLVAVARAAQAGFKPGTDWTFVVAGRKDAEPWTFKVNKAERLRTALGELNTVHVIRMPPDGDGQQIDIWLAPQRDWYPVRLRFADDNGDYIEQTLESVVKKVS